MQNIIIEYQFPSYSLPESKFPVLIEDLGYCNPYDFTKEHRHKYFEIILFKNGGGKQWIDFKEISVQDYSCYIILPGQVHLLKRAADSLGSIIQFQESEIESSCLRNYLLFSSQPIIFDNSGEKFAKIIPYLDLIRNMQKNAEHVLKLGCRHLLQAFLFQLLGIKDEIEACKETEVLHYQFVQMVEENFIKYQTVQEYALQLQITEKKLTTLTKKHFGITPLQLIHNRIVLESKRLLAFKNISCKEVAYQLGFASPSSFNRFIKDKTGLSPNALRDSLINPSL